MFDVITIGTAVRDTFVKSEDFKVIDSKDFSVGKALALPLGAKIDVDDMFFTTGGVATNASVTFARQGLSSACFCRIGEDVSGQAVIKDLEDNGVDSSLVVRADGEKTGYSVLLLTSGGERTIVTFRGASAKFPTSEVPESLPAKWIYIGGSVSLDFIRAVLDKAKQSDARVAMAPSRVHLEEGLESLEDILKEVSLLTLNREEAAKLTGLPYEDEQDIFSKLDEYVKNIVVMTEGPKGVLVSDGDTIYRAGIFKEEKLVDRTGAGDAFGSGLVAALAGLDDVDNASGDDIKRAIRLGSANATSVVEHIGAKAGILNKESFDNDSRWSDLDVNLGV